jgi:hypothetical protein
MTTLIQSNELLRERWLHALQAAAERLKRAGWEFLELLRDGIEQLPRTNEERAKLYDDASSATGLAVHTLQNYVSALRKPYAKLAHELDLDFGHLVEVQGLEEEIAEDVLQKAAENAWPVARTRKEAWARKNAPDVGKQLADAAEDYLSGDDDPPWVDQTDAGPAWNDEYFSIPREPVAAATVIRAQFDEGEIAALIAALLR